MSTSQQSLGLAKLASKSVTCVHKQDKQCSATSITILDVRDMRHVINIGPVHEASKQDCKYVQGPVTTQWGNDCHECIEDAMDGFLFGPDVCNENDVPPMLRLVSREALEL